MRLVVTASHAGAGVLETCQRGTGEPSPAPHQDAGVVRPCRLAMGPQRGKHRKDGIR
jgi:hypothetical protein